MKKHNPQEPDSSDPDRKTWSLLDAFSSIEPSLGFRSRLWQRVEEESVGRPILPVPALPTWALGMIFIGIWGLGLGSGVLLFQKTVRHDLPATEKSMRLFTEVIPENSIEESFLLNKSDGNLSKRNSL